jgi:hypothetical protein
MANFDDLEGPDGKFSGIPRKVEIPTEFPEFLDSWSGWSIPGFVVRMAKFDDLEGPDGQKLGIPGIPGKSSSGTPRPAF